MVRFRYKRPTEKTSLYFPFYIETWTQYDPNDTTNCTDGNGWLKVWTPDDDRDKLHRKNSYYYRRDIEAHEEEFLQDSPTLAILLFGSIIFCLFVPQILDLILSRFCQGSERPPSPPTPPQGPKTRMRIRLYHYAKVSNRAPGRKSFVGKDNFYYNPDNILNYVSATRIKALHEYIDDEDYVENLTSIQP